MRNKITVPEIRKLKIADDGRFTMQHKLAMVTAYDASFSRLIDQSDVDLILVGDSLGMVVKGEDNTLPVTMEEMIYHCRSVRRGAERALVVGDMPFMSYQASVEDGIRNAGRLVKEGGVEAVKIEGGREYVELVRRLTSIGIPVMGHIGLTPQSVHAMGGFKVQGRGASEAVELKRSARALADAGCFAIVLEGMPSELAAQITAQVSVPTIGIGAGAKCDGQVLVIYDLLGMNETFRPKFVKKYENLSVRIRTAVEQYVSEVRAGQFPDAEHSFSKTAPAPDATPYAKAAAGGKVERDPDATGAACIPLPVRPFPKK